jgi:hypothetical protein
MDFTVMITKINPFFINYLDRNEKLNEKVPLFRKNFVRHPRSHERGGGDYERLN